MSTSRWQTNPGPACLQCQAIPKRATRQVVVKVSKLGGSGTGVATKAISGDAGGPTHPTISPLSLIPWAEVQQNPGTSMVVKLPPIYRKPKVKLKDPTIWPLLLIPLEKVLLAPGTLIAVTLPPVYRPKDPTIWPLLLIPVGPPGSVVKLPPVSTKPWDPSASTKYPTICPLSLIP